LELNKFGMVPESVHSAGLEYITAFGFNSVAFAIQEGGSLIPPLCVRSIGAWNKTISGHHDMCIDYIIPDTAYPKTYIRFFYLAFGYNQQFQGLGIRLFYLVSCMMNTRACSRTQTLCAAKTIE